MTSPLSSTAEQRNNVVLLGAAAAGYCLYHFLLARHSKREAFIKQREEASLFVEGEEESPADDSQLLRLAEKLRTIEQEGLENLVIIADFDRTLSAFGGKKPKTTGQTAHGICEVHLSEGLQAKAKAINAYFYPIEVDPSVPLHQKIPLMEQWYLQINNLLIEAGFRRSHIASSVRDANVKLRPGVKELLDFCKEKSVPLIIFSAGVGDILKEVLKQQYGPLPKLSTIVSNWMRFAPVSSEEGEGDLGPNSAAATGGNMPSPAEFSPINAGAGAAPSPHVIDPGEQQDFVSPSSSSSASAAAATSSFFIRSGASDAASAGSSISSTSWKQPKQLKAPEQRLVGWSSPLIHMFNKELKNAVIHNPRVSELWRRNALLLGDGIGDAAMACSPSEAAASIRAAANPAAASESSLPQDPSFLLPSPKSGISSTVLRVGIVNTNVEALLPKYTPAFDALLLRDPSLASVNALLARLPSSPALSSSSSLHSTGFSFAGEDQKAGTTSKMMTAVEARQLIQRLLMPEMP